MPVIDEIKEDNYLKKRQEEHITNSKFEVWDNLLNIANRISNEDFKRRASMLWRDPTIWAYACLKDNDGNPLQLYPFQDRFINDKNRFVHAHAANQIGKTLALEVKAAHHITFVDNSSIILVSSTEKQSIKILDEIKWLIERSKLPFKNFVGDVNNRMEM